MRKIGSNEWLKPGVDFEAEDEVFAKARYLGEEEGQFGVYQTFQNLDTKECFNLGGGHLNWLCSQIEVGDEVRLVYLGEEKLTKGKFKGKNSHQYELWLLEDEDGPAEESPKASKRSRRKPEPEVVAEDDDLDDEVAEEEEPPTRRRKAAKKKTGRVSKKKN